MMICSGGQEAHEDHMDLNEECPWQHEEVDE